MSWWNCKTHVVCPKGYGSGECGHCYHSKPHVKFDHCAVGELAQCLRGTTSCVSMETIDRNAKIIKEAGVGLVEL